MASKRHCKLTVEEAERVCKIYASNVPAHKLTRKDRALLWKSRTATADLIADLEARFGKSQGVIV